jgi:hypothetical protein
MTGVAAEEGATKEPLYDHNLPEGTRKARASELINDFSEILRTLKANPDVQKAIVESYPDNTVHLTKGEISYIFSCKISESSYPPAIKMVSLRREDTVVREELRIDTQVGPEKNETFIRYHIFNKRDSTAFGKRGEQTRTNRKQAVERARELLAKTREDFGKANVVNSLATA